MPKLISLSVYLFHFSGTPDGTNQNNFNHEQDEVDLSSTSSCAEDKAEADSILNITGSPMTMTFGKKVFLCN